MGLIWLCPSLLRPLFRLRAIARGSYTVTVSNQGPVSASGVIISNVLSGNLVLTGVAVAAGRDLHDQCQRQHRHRQCRRHDQRPSGYGGADGLRAAPAAFPGFRPGQLQLRCVGIIDLANTNNAAAATNSTRAAQPGDRHDGRSG